MNLIIAIVLFLYFCLAASTMLMYLYCGLDWFIAYVGMFFYALCILGLFFYRIKRIWRWVQKGSFVLLLVYICLLLYGTLFMRIGMDLNTPVLTQPFSRITEAFATGNWTLLVHFIFNMALFAPLGIFLQTLDPNPLNRWGNALLFGLMLSTIIEGLQMILMLGESDIDDIIANTLGCILGFLFCRLWITISHKWQI